MASAGRTRAVRAGGRKRARVPFLALLHARGARADADASSQFEHDSFLFKRLFAYKG